MSVPRGGLRVAFLLVVASHGATAQAPRPADTTTVVTGVVLIRGGSRLPAALYVPGAATRSRADTATVDQQGLAYVPAVTIVPPGATVEFRNSDPVVHNVFSPTRATGRFDLGRYGPDQARTHTFGQAGPALILCRIHPEMVAYVLVVDAATWTIAAPDGQFRLQGVPPRAGELIVWHPHAGTRRVSLQDARRGPLVISLPSR
jgi:plastocyanin